MAKRLSFETLNRQVFFADQTIFRERDEGLDAFVIERGKVEISKEGSQGTVVIGVVAKGGIFGEMALIDDSPRMATARAVKETVCVLIPKADFRAALKNSDPFLRALLRIFVANIRSQTDLRLFPEFDQIENRRIIEAMS